jgi:hypothetical protein
MGTGASEVVVSASRGRRGCFTQTTKSGCFRGSGCGPPRRVVRLVAAQGGAGIKRRSKACVLAEGWCLSQLGSVGDRPDSGRFELKCSGDIGIGRQPSQLGRATLCTGRPAAGGPARTACGSLAVTPLAALRTLLRTRRTLLRTRRTLLRTRRTLLRTRRTLLRTRRTLLRTRSSSWQIDPESAVSDLGDSGLSSVTRDRFSRRRPGSPRTARQYDQRRCRAGWSAARAKSRRCPSGRMGLVFRGSRQWLGGPSGGWTI